MKKKRQILIAATILGVVSGAIISLALANQTPPEREAQIRKWLVANEPEPTGFSPSVENRGFWEKQNATQKQDPPTPEDLQNMLEMNSAGLGGIITRGTDQELAFNTGAWISTIETVMLKLLDEPWSEKLQNNEFTDLHATSTGATLARTVYSLKEKLNPVLVERALNTLRRKVTGPYLRDVEKYQKEKLSWKQDMCPWLETKSNWTAVCVNNILYTILATEPNPEIRAHAIAISEAPLKEYLQSIEEDGYLASGIRYWNYGLGHMLILTERIAKATGGNIILTENEKLKKMGRFKENWLAARKGNEEYFPLFGDNNNPITRQVWVEELCSRRFGTETPEIPAVAEAGNGAIFDLLHWLPKTKRGKGIQPKEESSFYESAGVLLARKQKTLFAIKAGSNSEEHNHNDVGAYTLLQNGEYITGDAGTIGYTMRLFGNERYENDVTSSYGHPVPVVNSHLQTKGKTSVGAVLEKEISPEKDRILYDIKSAYKCDELKKLTREVVFQKNKPVTITITDSWEATHPIWFESPIIYGKGKKTGNTIEIEDFTISLESTNPTEISEERFWKEQAPMKRVFLKALQKEKSGKTTTKIVLKESAATNQEEKAAEKNSAPKKAQ